MSGFHSIGEAPIGALSDAGPISVAIADALNASDASTTSVYLALIDSFGAWESYAADVMPWIADVLSAGDAVTGSGRFVRFGSDTLRASDALAARLSVLLADSVSISDAAQARLILALRDTLVATDAAPSFLKAQLAIAEAMALNDLLNAGLAVDVADSAEFSDALANALRAAATIVDAAVLADNATPTARFTVLVPDSAAISDSASAAAHLQAAIADSLDVFASIRLDDTEYAAWVLNTESKAPFEYRNFPFDSMASFGGRYFGAREDGLYELEVGDTDEGEPIEAWIRAGLSNLGTGKMKSMPAMYLGYRSSGALVLKVVTTSETGAKQEDWYEMTAQTADAICEGRIKIGKGLKSVYWGFELRNKAGADFELDVVSLYPLILSRRV